ncbi:DNA helicase IV [Budviciaceae bacterium CWB-B4]|uniref:DNA 3'-5' helicase n=1 Tax=Limnobaculum xujianqingii TaxID=2738837 RepID=A0A9D7FZ16_9GAMM|nr:DNA helicase IV [Limnobaculum xujianqingii]MBK5073725.1 DNA helicase IV [Limnobaculum xujianqingii]MBK5177381.1 DNA helicase IV [Limnobaculum xujianqingii]
MELKSTSVGQHLAQHPYNRVKMLNAGVEVSGPKHAYTIPFNQLVAVRCKRGIVWGELEFELPGQKVVRLHGTEWQDTQRFYQHLMSVWQKWGEEMSLIAADILTQQAEKINARLRQERWLTHDDLSEIQDEVTIAVSSVPLPVERLIEFANCQACYAFCSKWLTMGNQLLNTSNRHWVQTMLKQHRQFFDHIETQPLNEAQCRAVISGEKNVLVLAGAGSGKTSVLVARAGWLLYRKEATAEEVLLLAFGRNAADEMNNRIQQRLGRTDVQAKTFHALALLIISQCSKKVPIISKLETDTKSRQTFLIKQWQSECAEKKSQASGWKSWLSQELEWQLAEDAFWKDSALSERLAVRLDYWLGLIRNHGGSQAEMIESAPEELKADFQKKIRLLSPLLKAWKKALKEEGAVDFPGLLHQAVNWIEKGKFVSPWRHILVDEFQDLSPQRAALINALRAQQTGSNLFAVGDDWQSIYRFSGAEQLLTANFNRIFGVGEQCNLDLTYRFGQNISDITSNYIQQNPAQIKRDVSSLVQGEKHPITILPDNQLEALFDKLSSYVKQSERILVLGRYHYSKPVVLAKAATRWPKLNIEFMTMHASKGQQAEYVIITGLHSGRDGFPSVESGAVIEQVLLPQTEHFLYAEERRLMYVALTRAKHQVWLLQNPESPSIFIKQLADSGAVIKRKP